MSGPRAVLVLGGILIMLSGRAGATPPADTPLPGWTRSVAGDTIGYHSSYPDVRRALLCRATDGTMSVAWDTATVPDGFAGGSASFLWLAGLAAGKGAHRFDLAIDGEPALSFRSGADDAARAWEAAAPDGVVLRFAATMVDQFGELFGTMTLDVPRLRLRPGRPLRLSVTGEAGGSPDWFMVFEHAPAEWVRAEGEPALRRGPDGPRQNVRVEISRLGPSADAVVSVAGAVAARARLVTGYNELRVDVPAVSAPADLALSVVVGDEPAREVTARLAPVRRRELWLLPHSHLDIGYSDRQELVERKHWGYLEQAIELAARTRDHPQGARFRWNVEQLWAVETWLRQATPAQRESFAAAVREGAIGLQALLAGVLTGLCHPEELFHLTDCARRLSRELGVPIDTAMITDIPSQSWSLVPALAQCGVRHLSSGPNYMPSLADGGDRVGGALRAWGDRPFRWVSPSGEERLLFWMAGRGYSWFHGLNAGPLRRGNERLVFDYLRELDRADYPYDLVQVRYTVGGDNGPPDPGLPDFVRDWNAEHESPRFVIATAGELFAELERRHGDRLPDAQGDLTPHWEDGAASTARETAMNRAAANRLLQAETAWALRDPGPFPADDFAEAWRSVVLFSEHTWGAAGSVSDPDAAETVAQWTYKRALALEADRRSRDLLARALAVAGPTAGVEVLNTLGFARTGVVLLPPALSAAGDRVLDEKGVAVPSQRLAGGELAVLAADVPGFGARRYRVVAGAAATAGGARAAGGALENEHLRAVVDPATGAVASLVWKPRGLELVDRSAGPGLNAWLYVAGRDPAAAAGAADAAVEVGEPGPLVASLVVRARAPGARSLRCELRLCAGADVLEIANTVDKLPVRAKESAHLAFPLRVPDGRVRIDIGWASIRPDADQLAGACRDWFCAHNAVEVAGASHGVVWVALDAPLVEVGALTDESAPPGGTRGWRERVGPSQTLYSYVMNNAWHTNYRADQEGEVLLRYAIRPHAGARGESARTGQDRARPLLVAAAGARPASPAPLTVADGALATSLRPLANGALLARVYNPSDAPCPAAVRASPGARLRRADPDGRPLAPGGDGLGLAPWAILGLRVERD